MSADLHISARQQEALNFVALYLRKHGQAPSYREIRKHLGLRSLGSVAGMLARLEARGLIQRAEQKSSWRCWLLTEHARGSL